VVLQALIQKMVVSVKGGGGDLPIRGGLCRGGKDMIHIVSLQSKSEKPKGRGIKSMMRPHSITMAMKEH